MNLYILRHAKAEEHGTRFPDDSKRPLTADGEKEMFRVARGMRELELAFDVILSSPFVRAKRTAEIVAEVFRFGKLRLSLNLASGGDPQKLIDELNAETSVAKNILLVGHEPYLSGLISHLATGGKALQLNFKKAGLCKLSIRELEYGRCATLEWLMKPGQLMRLGDV